MFLTPLRLFLPLSIIAGPRPPYAGLLVRHIFSSRQGGIRMSLSIVQDETMPVMRRCRHSPITNSISSIYSQLFDANIVSHEAANKLVIKQNVKSHAAHFAICRTIRLATFKTLHNESKQTCRVVVDSCSCSGTYWSGGLNFAVSNRKNRKFKIFQMC